MVKCSGLKFSLTRVLEIGLDEKGRGKRGERCVYTEVINYYKTLCSSGKNQRHFWHAGRSLDKTFNPSVFQSYKPSSALSKSYFFRGTDVWWKSGASGSWVGPPTLMNGRTDERTYIVHDTGPHYLEVHDWLFLSGVWFDILLWYCCSIQRRGRRVDRQVEKELQSELIFMHYAWSSD